MFIPASEQLLRQGIGTARRYQTSSLNNARGDYIDPEGKDTHHELCKLVLRRVSAFPKRRCAWRILTLVTETRAVRYAAGGEVAAEAPVR